MFLFFSHNLAVVLDFDISGLTQYTYIDGKYIYVFALAAKQVRKAHKRLVFLPVSKARTNEFYICRQCMYIIYILPFFIIKLHIQPYFPTCFNMKIPRNTYYSHLFCLFEQRNCYKLKHIIC